MPFTQQYFAVSVGGLQARASVDEARPTPASSTDLNWDSTQPLQPFAVVTNTTSMSTWQDWLVAAGVFLGMGGSLLASLLYDWARPDQPNAHPPGHVAQPAGRERPAHLVHRTAASAVALILVAWAIGSRRRRV